MTNPLPQLIPACQRVAKACGVEMPEQQTYGVVPDYYIPDDLYALMLVGWVCGDARDELATQSVELSICAAGSWVVGHEVSGLMRAQEYPDLTAALTAACDILDGRGEVG